MEQDTTTAPAAASDDAFAAGFTGTEPKQKPDAQPTVTETPPADDKEAPEYVQLTKQELADLKAAAAKTASYDKQFSTVFGTVGRFEQIVRGLQDQARGGDVKLSSGAFDKLKAEFPELADMTREAMQNALVDIKARPETDKAEFDRIRQERIDAEIDALEDAHPDWRDLTGAVPKGQDFDPEHPFRKWLASKDAAYQTRVSGTESASVFSRAIDKFLSETKPTAKPPTQTARAEAKREQIAGAVQARGDGGAPPATSNTVDDAFAAGFKKG